jgi:hypothetical protein
MNSYLYHFALAAGIILPVLPTHATDYPWTGVYNQGQPTTLEVQTPPEQVRMNCAFTFFIQTADGRSMNYVIDRAAFEKTGKPSYAVLMDVSCNFNPKTNSDVCKVNRSGYGSDESTSEFATIFTSITKDVITYRTFSSGAEMQAALKKKDDKAGTPFKAYACPFRAEQVKPFLTDAMTTLDGSQLPDVTLPEPTPENQSAMKRILAIIAGP